MEKPLINQQIFAVGVVVMSLVVLAGIVQLCRKKDVGANLMLVVVFGGMIWFVFEAAGSSTERLFWEIFNKITSFGM